MSKFYTLHIICPNKGNIVDTLICLTTQLIFFQVMWYVQCVDCIFFSYVGNTSSEKYRTVRMMVLESFYYFGYCIAGLVSGLILEATNYVFVFTASTWLYATLIVYIYTWLDPVESLQTNCTALNTPIVKSGVNPNVGHHDSTNDATSSVASDKDSNSTSQTANTKFDDARRRGLLWFSPRHIKVKCHIHMYGLII